MNEVQQNFVMPNLCSLKNLTKEIIIDERTYKLTVNAFSYCLKLLPSKVEIDRVFEFQLDTILHNIHLGQIKSGNNLMTQKKKLSKI